MTRHRTDTVIGKDGLRRRVEDERALDRLFGHVFGTPQGQALVTHLEQITIRAVSPETVSSEQLFYREGKREMVAYIRRRLSDGKQ